MRLLALVLVSSFLTACKHSTVNPLTNEHLNGKVRSVNESYYPVTGTGMPENSNSQSTNYYAFDNEGNMTQARAIDKNETGGALRVYEFKNGKPAGGVAKADADDYTINVVYNGGKLAEEQHIRKDGQDVFKYEYDGNGHRSGMKWYNGNGELVATFSNKLDRNGNITEQGIMYATDKVRTDYSYKYDSVDNKGNWVRRTVYSGGTPTTVTVRQIEYY